MENEIQSVISDELTPQADPAATSASAIAAGQVAVQLSAEKTPTLQLSGRPDSPLLHNETGEQQEYLDEQISIEDCWGRIGKLKESDALYHWALGSEYVLLKDKLRVDDRGIELKTGDSKTSINNHCLTFKASQNVPDTEKGMYLWSHYDLLRRGYGLLSARCQSAGIPLEVKGKRVEMLDTIKSHRCRHSKDAFRALAEMLFRGNADETKKHRHTLLNTLSEKEKKAKEYLYELNGINGTLFIGTTSAKSLRAFEPGATPKFLVIRIDDADGSPMLSPEVFDLLRRAALKEKDALAEWNVEYLPSDFSQYQENIRERANAISSGAEKLGIECQHLERNGIPTGRFRKDEIVITVEPPKWNDYIAHGIGTPAEMIAYVSSLFGSADKAEPEIIEPDGADLIEFDEEETSK